MEYTGTVARLFLDKGFGFIRGGDGREFFFHRSAVRGTRFDQLCERDAVSFEIGEGSRGPRAESVRVLA